MTFAWTGTHDELFHTLSDREVARQIHVSPETARRRRLRLGLPPAGSKLRQFETLMGTIPDTEIAMRAGMTTEAVGVHRRKLGIAPFVVRNAAKPSRALRGAEYDRMRQRGMSILEIARSDKLTVSGIHRTLKLYYQRLDRELGIPYVYVARKRWDPTNDHLLGTMTDARLGNQVGYSARFVRNRRIKLGVLACRVGRRVMPRVLQRPPIASAVVTPQVTQ